MRKPRSRPRRIPTNRPRIDCSGASSQLWLSKISTSERVEDLGTLGGDCGTARRVVQGALKLILEPLFELRFKRVVWISTETDSASRTSFEVGLLPTSFLTCEITVQYQRKPARCHRTRFRT